MTGIRALVGLAIGAVGLIGHVAFPLPVAERAVRGLALAPDGANLTRVAMAAGESDIKADDLWLAPDPQHMSSSTPLSRAVGWLATGDAERAREAAVSALADPLLGGYARLYQGRADYALGRFGPARESAKAVLERSPGGALGEAALWLLADAAEALSAFDDASVALQALVDTGSADPARVHFRLGRVADAQRNLAAARAAYAKVYYEFPLSDVAADAGAALAKLPAEPGRAQLALDLGRAEQLFAGRRFADARKAYLAVRAETSGDERSLLDLRVAQCDIRLARFTEARTRLQALVARTWVKRTEAEFALVAAMRGLRRDAAYVARARAFVTAHPTEPLAEQVLDELGTHYILADEDAAAAAVFTELYERFPLGSYAERAAWKAGWWAYRQRNLPEAIRLFESAAAGLSRADTRPAWLYWAARAHELAGDRDRALTGYRRTVLDYRNSYYGREAQRRMSSLPPSESGVAVLASASRPAPLALAPGVPPANTRLIRALLAAGLWDDAVLELRRLVRETGRTPLLDATMAFALNRLGQLRPAITAMRRAYPQFLAEGGETLPEPILQVIFPVQHWDLLRQYAAAHDLDPFLLAAQVAQESTFQADVRSAANAWGLMQILPSTGRRYAQRLGLRGFSTARLTDPETNVKIGTQYMEELIELLGGVAPALAAYNAGESRVSRWQAERPGLDQDEFVDDIPFPETQFYVKRILGTADDYRRLYGQPAASARVN